MRPYNQPMQPAYQLAPGRLAHVLGAILKGRSTPGFDVLRARIFTDARAPRGAVATGLCRRKGVTANECGAWEQLSHAMVRTPIVHVSPPQVVVHVHINSSRLTETSVLDSLHVPPFLHGLEAHSS